MIRVYSTDIIEEQKSVYNHFVKLTEKTHGHRATYSSFIFSRNALDYPFIEDRLRGVERKGIKKILDFGAGNGTMQYHLALSGYEEVWALDRRDFSRQVKNNQEKIGTNGAIIKVRQANFANNNLKNYPTLPLNYFDIVIANSSINHNWDHNIKTVVNNIWLCLKTGGMLIATLATSNIERDYFTNKEDDPMILVKKPKTWVDIFVDIGFQLYTEEWKDCDFDGIKKHAKNFSEFSPNNNWFKRFCPLGISLIKS
ncbi:MAG: methyltransferase domain-containing protein [Candidatus Lokiarchaeota archaeon]|nr:methyltransferase domain-containing protein [Candidatus Lokiarchaeota archaeon]